jgi:predicted ATPase/class 3 adenylate cyclase
LPAGTVTFAFTDIEGSTRRWEHDRLGMQEALQRHDSIVRSEVARHDGHVFKTVGDAFCCAFSRPEEAVAAMVAVQRAISAEDFSAVGGLRVRVALHTGTADERDGDYFGPAINRVARLVSIGHGGQVLLSEITRAIAYGALPAETSLVDLGSQRLKDLNDPEHVWQLDIAGLSSTFPPLRSVEVPASERALKNNLPLQLTSFIGRESEIAEIAHLLKDRRLVTLTGSGGVGKTRTALQIGDAMAGSLPDGVWFVELAPLFDAHLVPAAIARALQLQETPTRPLLETLSAFLKTKALLLILDNCEHVVEEAANVVTALLQRCQRLQILATSREPIRVSGEHTYRLPSLSAPSIEAAKLVAAEAAAYAAINLFVERARAVDQRFALTDENASIVAEICRRLDGIPLAIELAAARVRIFSPAGLARRLDERFRILTGGTRTAVPRQRTMWATIDWSHDLLDERERTLLRRVSVFSGGWTTEAAQVVCADSFLDEHEVFDLMMSLVEKSLVAAELTADEARYRLLESTQAYALEKLEESGERDAVARRHADWIAGLTVGLRKAFSTLPPEQFQRALEPEVDNIRAALSYASDTNDAALTVRILWLARVSNAIVTKGDNVRSSFELRRKKKRADEPDEDV